MVQEYANATNEVISCYMYERYMKQSPFIYIK